MDNDSMIFDAKKFDSVWKRVIDSSSSPETQDADTILKFMGDEYSDWQLYTTLARLCKGEARQVFSRAANDEKRHYQALRTRYYILTGAVFTPEAVTKPELLSIAPVLRQRYEEEASGAAAYLTAADKTSRPDIAAMYRSYSADETRHSLQILALINKLIGQ